MTKIVLSFGLCALSVIHAQVSSAPPEDASLKTVPKRFFSDEVKMWTSPFKSSSYGSHAVKKYVIPFALISAALIATDTRTSDILPNTPDQTKWSGRVSQLGAWYSLGGFTAGTFLYGKIAGDNHAREAGLLSLEALGHAQIAVFAIKEATNRQRPLDGSGGGGFWQGGNAFPSGHSASAFAVATVFSYEYRDHLAVPIVAYSTAALISASRLSARRHWVSDIFVGGSLGFMVGRFTYRRNHNPNLPGSKVSRTDRLMPQVGFGRYGPALSWKL
jgi:membrane-associated phospholipid phosphatase